MAALCRRRPTSASLPLDPLHRGSRSALGRSRAPAGVTAGRLCSLLASLAISGAVSFSAATHAAPRLIVTIDVESQALALPEQVDAVCSDGSACGLLAIADELRDRGIRSTFFLNVYEFRKWGEPVMADIAARLQQAGHDVALHTHPQWAYDPSRNEMYQYSLDEQTQIVREGAALLSKWTGRPVVAHRAGDYSADERTITALSRNGVRVDSSLFPGNPRSHLTRLGLPPGAASMIGSLVEIPVTTYERAELPRWFPDFFAPVTSIRKIDPNWFIDASEASRAIDGLIEAQCPYIVVFLHSFSFLRADTGKPPLPDARSRHIFDVILDKVREQGLTAMTMRDVAEGSGVSESQCRLVPRVTVTVGMPRYLLHRGRSLGADGIRAAVLLLAFPAGLASLLVIAKRRLCRAHGIAAERRRER